MKYDKEDALLFSEFDKEIQKLADEEILILHKTSQTVDEKAIREKNKKFFFQNLEKKLENSLFQYLNTFWVQLKVDDTSLYEKLTKSKVKIEKTTTPDYTTFKNLKAQFFKIFTKEVIDKLSEIAEGFYAVENFERARIYFVVLVSLKPKDPYTWLIKGLTEQHAGKYDEAFQSYLSAATIDPSYVLPYLQITECLLLTGKKQEAVNLFEAAEKQIFEQNLASNPLYATKTHSLKNALTGRSL